MMPYLGEPNILALLSEALTADVEPVFPNQAGFVRANAAVHHFMRLLTRLWNTVVGRERDDAPGARTFAVVAGARVPD